MYTAKEQAYFDELRDLHGSELADLIIRLERELVKVYRENMDLRDRLGIPQEDPPPLLNREET